jgi:nicotinate-nucleotide adenylyltransferase
MAQGMSVTRRIGLFGGSFNPAHAGHFHLAMEAMKRLKLAEIWWLVSPHNPLKNKNSLADYQERFTSAQTLAHHPRMTVSDIEQRHTLRYSYDTLRFLRRRHPRVEFVWLMGADNLAGFHRWQKWRNILQMMPVVVFDRSPFSHTALKGKAAVYARQLSIYNNKINHNPLTFIRMKRHPLSSTAIRKHLEKSRK